MTRLRRFPLPRWLSAWVFMTGGLLGCSGESEPLDARLQHEKPSASLLAVGDTGRPHRWFPGLFEGQVAVANGMAAEDEREPIDAVILLGDNFYNIGVESVTDPQWDSKFETPYANINLPFYPALGNHDGGVEFLGEELGAGLSVSQGNNQVDYTNAGVSPAPWTPSGTTKWTIA